YKSSFSSHLPDSLTGKTGKLYYMYERYKDSSSAHSVYSGFKSSNAVHNHLKNLPFADEGYYQESPPFILARKGKELWRFKVNKSTSHTDITSLFDISRKIMSN